jgi:LacI family transcriptional regulator
MFDDGWTNEVTAGARAGAASLVYDLVLTQERDDPMDDWPRRVAARRSSGVVLGLIKPSTSQLHILRGLNIPLVLLDPTSESAGRFESIGTTDRQGGWDVGAHLVAQGHRRFVLVAGEPHFRFGRAREEGFHSAVRELAPNAEIITIKGNWQEDDLTPKLQPAIRDFGATAVFACNDAMAAGVYRSAARMGLRIPRDLSVVGFDDTPRYAGLSPALTTIRQPIRAMATRAVELVEQLRNGTLTQLERIEVPTALIVRDSTRAPRS